MKTVAYSLALISSLVATVGASVAPRQGQVCLAVVVPNTPITADGTGVSGLQLGSASLISPSGTGSAAILTTNGYQTWNGAGGGLGSPWCPTSRWLNIGSSTHPWKPLSWSSTETTTTWKSSGGRLTAGATSSYAETSDFLACKPVNSSISIGAPSVQWLLFLNPGGTVPTVSDDTLSNANLTTCTKTRLTYWGPSLGLIGSGL